MDLSWPLPSHILRLNDREVRSGPVIYWMSRDQRVFDNGALHFAQQQALLMQQPLIVVFNFVPFYPGATHRHFHFMISGLMEVETVLRRMHIPMILMKGEAEVNLPDLVQQTGAGMLVTDSDPLRHKRTWVEQVVRRLSVAFYEADAHNIVPCRIASSKQEYGAYTLRPKLKRLLGDHLHEPPRLISHPFNYKGKLKRPEWEIQPDTRSKNGEAVTRIKSGSAAGIETLRTFIDSGLEHYQQYKNDPNRNVLSGLSPYLHFGQISALRVAIEVKKAPFPEQLKQGFLDELIVRRELSDNYCFYNPHYDSFIGLPGWAQETLNAHRNDEREHLYCTEQFEAASTHDMLWNAAQRQLLEEGKMHGYMRMYWAKKILEWSATPEEAIATAIYLNDTYSLDGRDPNGYAGIMWSIGGLHDRPWFNRAVYGKVRYMNANGCKAKFDTQRWIRKYLPEE